MKERPILFSGEMVMAILEGRKTQTRRVIKLRDFEHNTDIPWAGDWMFRNKRGVWSDVSTKMLIEKFCPHGKLGDRLWVRETWRTETWRIGELDDGLDGILYKADWGFHAIEDTVGVVDAWMEANFAGMGKWRSSIFMPRWASRITLEITDVRVERLLDISKADARSEGMYCGFEPPYDFSIGPYDAYTANFRRLWDKINAKRGFGWVANPWVWVIEFKVVEGDRP